MVVGSNQISIIQGCAPEEFASYLRHTDINDYNKYVPERSCWDGQLQNKTSELCLDTELLLFLMAMNGIFKGSEAAGDEIPTADDNGAGAPRDSRLFSTLCTRVKRGMRRTKRPASQQGAYVCGSPVLEPLCYSTVQSAVPWCSTANSDRTVVHNEIFAHHLGKPRSTTNVLRLIEATD